MCEAERWLGAPEWGVVQFFGLVRDQVVNLNPMGEPVLRLRLEAVAAACELAGVPAADRWELTEMVRDLHLHSDGGSKPDRDLMRTSAHLLAGS